MNPSTPDRANYKPLTLERTYDPANTSWLEWSQHVAGGAQDFSNVTLSYLDGEDRPARMVDFQNCWPIRHDVINVDSRSGSSSIREVLELVVERATYR